MDCGPWKPLLCSFSDCDVLPILVRGYQTHTSHVYEMKDGNLRQCLHVQVCDHLHCAVFKLFQRVHSPPPVMMVQKLFLIFILVYNTDMMKTFWESLSLFSFLSFLFQSDHYFFSFPSSSPHEAENLLEMWNARK